MRTVIPMINGLFSRMNSYTFKADLSKSQLDTIFYANYGRRNPTPIVDVIAEKHNAELTETLPDSALNELAGLLLAMYKPKWDKLGEIYDIEYDPIHNYLDEWEDELEENKSGTENVDSEKVEELNTTRTDSFTRTDNLSENITRNLGNSNQRTDNLTELETRNLTQSNSSSDADNVFAFDSNSAVPKRSGSESGSGSDTGTLTTANTGTQTITGTETGTVGTTNSGTQTNAGTRGMSGDVTTTIDEDKASSEDREQSRSGRHIGNIGNLTSQKQLQEEIDLWKWNYMRSILQDAADFLCVKVYLNF